MSKAGKRFAVLAATLIAAVTLMQVAFGQEDTSSGRLRAPAEPAPVPLLAAAVAPRPAMPAPPPALVPMVPPNAHGAVTESVAAPTLAGTGTAADAPAPAAASVVVSDVRPITYTIRMRVTAYCPCTRCCGPDAHGVTASGRRVSYNGGRFVAADTNVLPFNTRVSIPGYNGGQPVEVIDRGGAIKGNRLDVFFPDHATARRWGVRYVDVTVLRQ